MSKSRATFGFESEPVLFAGRRVAGRNLWWVAAIHCGFRSAACGYLGRGGCRAGYGCATLICAAVIPSFRIR